MAARGPRPATLLLLAACLALASGDLWNPLYDLFRKNHVDNPKTVATNDNAYCNKLMWERLLYWTYSNTFINSPIENINKVCTTDGKAAGPGKQQSNAAFAVTTCTFNPWSLSYTGVSSTVIIVISCLNELPVLYVKSVSQPADIAPPANIG